MTIKKRNFGLYLFLNVITLGIYGFIENIKIGNEIDALCKGDGERPRMNYVGAVMIRGIAPFLGIIIGLIIGIINVSYNSLSLLSLLGANSLYGSLGSFWNIGYTYLSSAGAIVIFTYMTLFGTIFGTFGSIISGIYLKYWWYKQGNRLKLNAYRYGLDVKEGGTELFVFRTFGEILLLPISYILRILGNLTPMVIICLICRSNDLGAIVFAFVLMFICIVPTLLFGMEYTAGGAFSNFFIIRTLNRYAEVYRNGAMPFEPMGYEYYPAASSKYPNFVPNLNDGMISAPQQVIADVPVDSYTDDMTGASAVNSGTVLGALGSISGIKGSCAGYDFDLSSGEEIIIGKDAKVSSVVIDPIYKEISRKHCGVSYDLVRDQYCVTDYSSNGTWADGRRLTTGTPTMLPHGTKLKLANDKNVFRLG